MSAKTLISVAEFDRLEEEEFRYEMDEGELITLTRPGTDHGRIERRLFMVLQTYLDAHGGGEAFGPDILFVLGPQTKRAPDVSVVLREVGSVKEIPGAPDRCSRTDSAKRILLATISSVDIHISTEMNAFKGTFVDVHAYFAAGNPPNGFENILVEGLIYLPKV